MQDGETTRSAPPGASSPSGLPLPEDPQWKADQVTILQALGCARPGGESHCPPRRGQGGRCLRGWTQEDPSIKERETMLAQGLQQVPFGELRARSEFAKGDDLIREADHLLAQGNPDHRRSIQGRHLEKPEGYAAPFPDLLTFHDAPTTIELTLFEMHLKHRMRAFQGAFHANPDYALWYGWSEMLRDLTEIKEKAAELRSAHAG